MWWMDRSSERMNKLWENDWKEEKKRRTTKRKKWKRNKKRRKRQSGGLTFFYHSIGLDCWMVFATPFFVALVETDIFFNPSLGFSFLKQSVIFLFQPLKQQQVANLFISVVFLGFCRHLGHQCLFKARLTKRLRGQPLATTLKARTKFFVSRKTSLQGSVCRTQDPLVGCFLGIFWLFESTTRALLQQLED